MLNKVNQDALDNIMDCFTGADGGVSLIKLRTLLESCQNENSSIGDMVIDFMLNFSELIDVANKNE